MRKHFVLFMLLVCVALWGVSGIWAGTPFDEDKVIIPKTQGSSEPTSDWHVPTWVNPDWKNPVNGACESGYFKTSTQRYGTDVCLRCSEGRYIPSKERCVVCKEGYYYSEANDRCQK